MKKTLAILAATCWLIDLTHAQTTAITGTGGSPSIAGYQIGEQGANSQVWQKITRTADSQGSATLQTNQAYIELASGLNHLVNGQWVESREEIDILPNGTAAATNGQHQAYFPGDIYNGEIELVTPDGKHLRSRPMGLSYFDGTNSVLITELTNSIGLVAGHNQVIYPNAFTGFAADVRYTYTKAGFEQDIILREQPPTPESFGLNPATARLQVLTEFFSPPQPTIQSTAMPIQAGLSLTDQSLGFGTMQMMPGRAFMLGENATDAGVRVGKQWLQLNGRQFLVEEVPVEAIADKLAELPLPAVLSSSSTTTHTVSSHLVLPPQRLAKTTTQPMLLARAPVPTQGLVLDYQTVNGTFANYTFQGDTTYYISGTVNLSGTNTFEGGTVIKYTNSSDAELVLNASLGSSVWTFQTGPYRPAIFTSIDDNSVGETISGSTGSPTNTQATYLCLPADNGYPSYPVQYARFAYAGTAIYQETRLYCSPVLDCQFVNCMYAIQDAVITLFNTPIQELHNVLMSNCGIGVQSVPGFAVIVDGENMTADQLDILLEGVSASISGTLTNCIFTGIGSLLYTPNGSGTITLNNCVQAADGSGIYQTVGAGNYYLVAGSTNQNTGITNIDPTLLADLRQKTTCPPLLLTNQTVATDTTLSPQAQRDTDMPDLGYHYDPIDYLVDQYVITNATLMVTNGAAIASYNETGIQLRKSSAIVSVGSPLYPNWFVRYSSVQEQAVSLGGTNPAAGRTVSVLRDTGLYCCTVGPTGQYRFSKFTCPAGGGIHFYHDGLSAYNSLQVQDCELLGGGLNDFSGYLNTVTTLKNNLFARSAFTAFPNAPTSLWVSNNLFWGTTVSFWNRNTTNTWQAFNNAFDSCIIAYNPYQTIGRLTNGYNAYLNCTGYYGDWMGQLWPTNVCDIVTNVSLAYRTGPLGAFYQPTNSSLINKGSTNANLLGLYHYTTQTNQVKETNSIVDIGYHYVAVYASGNPIDTDGDGIPDYLEDANGNGLVDNGETSWTNYNSANGLISGKGVVVFTPLK